MLAFPSALSLFSSRPRGMFDDLLGESFFGDFFNFPRFENLVQSSPGPSAYCRVQEKGLELELEVPRFRKEDIKVEAEEKTGRLLISGCREAPKGAQKGTFHVAGSSIPSFRRVFTIDPRAYDLKKISTNIQDGVLTVLIPHIESKKTIEQHRETAPPDALTATDTSGAGGAPSESNIPIARESSAMMEAKAPEGGEIAATKQEGQQQLQQQPQQQLVNTFRWPPKMEIIPKSDTCPLTYAISMPPGMTNPDVSLHVLQPGFLCLDVSHTTKSENEFGFNEQRLSFSRTIPLPEGITKEKVNASLKDDKLLIMVNE